MKNWVVAVPNLEIWRIINVEIVIGQITTILIMCMYTNSTMSRAKVCGHKYQKTIKVFM